MDICPCRPHRASVVAMSNALHIDEPDAFLTRHLTSDGFRVVDDESPDLALLRDATAVADFRSRFGNVPVIVLGGPESDTVDRGRAFERGCDDFLARPFASLLAPVRADPPGGRRLAPALARKQKRPLVRW